VAIQEDLRGPAGTVDEPCPPFVVHVSEQGSGAGPAVMCVTGEVDLATAPEMQRVMLQLLNNRTTHLVVDMSCVSFIDCFGLGVLVDVANVARVFGGSLVLRSPSRQVRQIRELVELNGVLPTEAA
jgi:anti-sigma B factor antagonist